MPKISVILTSYNHEKYLAEAIDSVLAQTFTDYELLIVDDCSSDSSWDIIQSYGDPRIVAIRNEVNKMGPVYYNLHRCKGQYIAMHHSDDSWMPDKLEKQVTYLDAHPEVAACFTWVQFMNEEGADINPTDGFYTDKLFSQPNRSRFEWLNRFFYEGNCLCHPSILIRKEAYTQYGLFTHGLAQIPDFVQWIRLCNNAEIYILREKLTKYRLRDNQANASGGRKPAVIRSTIETYFHLREYLHIQESGFREVFPEAMAYQTPEGLMVEYAFARLLLSERHMASWSKLFGLEILYHLLNDPEKSARLKVLYDFTNIDFIKLTEQYDVFGHQASAMARDMLNSTSWKITKPLRTMKRLLKR